MTYNLTLLQQKEGVVGLVEYVNYATTDLFSAIMVISLYFILLLALKRFDFVQSVMASSFVMFFVSIFLVYAELLNFVFPLFFISVVAVIALYAYTSTE